MSTEPPPEPPEPTGEIPCPRCGARVPEDQDWCLECGLAARTVVAPTPKWRVPLIVAAVVGALALAAIAVAFVDLTEDPRTVPAPVATTAAPPATTTPTVPAAPAPPGTTTPPAVTVPAPTTVPGGTGGAAAPDAPTATAPSAPEPPPQP